MTFLTAIWEWIKNLDPRIWQAVVAGLFLAIGWLVNGRQNRKATAIEAQHGRDEAAALRAERLRDVHRALYAEIGAHLASLESTDAILNQCDDVVQMMEQDPDYIPFLGRERRDQVFQAIVGDIHVLPRTSIDAVVAYYAQLSAIEAMTDDIRSDAFARLSVERRIDLYRDYMGFKAQALAFGNHALLMINAYSVDGPEGAKTLEKKLKSQQLNSRRDEGPSAT